MAHLRIVMVLIMSAVVGYAVASDFIYTISGDLKTAEFDGQKAYLMLNDNNRRIDSAMIVDGRFTMSGPADAQVLARVDAGRLDYATLILSPGCTEVDFTAHAPLSGDSVNMEYRAHKLKESALKDVADVLVGYYSANGDKDKAREAFSPFLNAYLDYMKATIAANPDNAISEAALRSFAMQSTPEQWGELYPTLPSRLLDLNFTRKWNDKMQTSLRMRPGAMFVDIEGKTPGGSPARLSDYVGKGRYVLVDFWASWCGPCRAEAKETLVPLYEKYGSDDRFEILGVATWDKPSRTLKAINQEGYKWPQIIDAGKMPMEKYGFDGIPMIILFAPDGTIMARGIRGSEIWDAVKAALSL